MDGKFTILRDLGAASTASPFDAFTARAEVAEVVAEPRVETQELTKRELRDVVRDPEVRAVAPVMPTKLISPVDMDEGNGPAAAAGAVAWGISAIGADVSARTGAGTVVSVLDTGIDADHAAFAGVTLVQQDFSGSGLGDKVGHGTHCAGTIFGRAVDGTRIGVAPGVTKAVIGKVLGDNGSGDTDMLLRGIEWAFNEGAEVISMSLGFDFPGLVNDLVEHQDFEIQPATSLALDAYRANLRLFDALMQLNASRAAFGTGTVVVAAAGNESRRPDYEISVSIPAAAEGIVSVGAVGEGTGTGLVVANFSNTFPQISAPGVKIISAQAGGGLRALNGTSMATPHVAGAAALWWEEIKALPIPTTATNVTARLLSHADTAAFAPNVDVADRGIGIVRAP